MPFPNFELLASADADASSGFRGRWRTLRRLVQRSLLDQNVRNETRFFCQNSGACGSHYIVDLLNENGVERVFHEKEPDLNEIGVRHFDSPISRTQLIRTLRYTRHNVYFEANNRLFSLSNELADAFPAARFIHLFRHPANAVRSAMSKPNVTEYLRTNLRFSGTLAGDSNQCPLERFCHYWANINQRIHDDLVQLQDTGREVIWLDFDDLIAGDLASLEKFIGHELPRKQRSPSNVGAVRSEGKFGSFDQWTDEDQNALSEICIPVFESLRLKTTAKQ
ncbi:sulfotransferase [Mariniblastus fucicola]|uniref:Sulfotransferase domain protein n=1 Tax=Mariniblastus fucicola TaxID=980251 RepID=A0A5B9P404_9BACT|nr:sulfotransferase [Mariniblastus fucicola]QEG21138.1 hypothetical protein MFFC18_09920 [Mariniblastus fucicola]